MQFVILFVLALCCVPHSFAFMMTPHKTSSVAFGLRMATTDKLKPNVIGKGDLLTKLQEITSFKKKDLDVVISSLIEVIQADVLVGGSELRLRDFGTFKQKNIAAREGRNPKTGEAIKIGRSSTVTFSPSDTSFRIRH